MWIQPTGSIRSFEFGDPDTDLPALRLMKRYRLMIPGRGQVESDLIVVSPWTHVRHITLPQGDVMFILYYRVVPEFP